VFIINDLEIFLAKFLAFIVGEEKSFWY